MLRRNGPVVKSVESYVSYVGALCFKIAAGRSSWLYS